MATDSQKMAWLYTASMLDRLADDLIKSLTEDMPPLADLLDVANRLRFQAERLRGLANA